MNAEQALAEIRSMIEVGFSKGFAVEFVQKKTRKDIWHEVEKELDEVKDKEPIKKYRKY